MVYSQLSRSIHGRSRERVPVKSLAKSADTGYTLPRVVPGATTTLRPNENDVAPRANPATSSARSDGENGRGCSTAAHREPE